MKWVLIIVLGMVLLPAYSVWGWQARVIDVLDGETLIVQLRNGIITTVKLYGIETPGMGEPFGDEARRFTALSVYTDKVEVRPIELGWARPEYTPGLVFMTDRANRLLNQELIRNGYARVDHPFCKLPICSIWERFQQEARQIGLGMWRK